MSVSLRHQPVLLHEVIAALNVRPEGVYVDATFGRGGHAAEILKLLGPGGRLLALDRDPEAARHAQLNFGAEPRFCFQRAAFGRLAEVMEAHGLTGKVHGILLDLGVSSPQLEDAARGFSCYQDGPLDMRMDPTTGNSAAQWLASATAEEISRVLKEFGEERFHRRIAGAIVTARQREPVVSTARLASIIAGAVRTRERGKHPATRSFQAIRIFINGELAELASALAQAIAILAADGRLVVISFHSLEDRIVKRFMRNQARAVDWPPGLPAPVRAGGAAVRIIGRPQRPSAAEAMLNPRSRSAVMRVAERLA